MMHELMLIGGMTLVTFPIRYVLLAVSGRVNLPPRLQQALNYVPPVVLTAIVTPIVLVSEDTLWLSIDNPRLVGAMVALAIGFWRKNLLLTIVASMAVFWLWQTLI